MAIKVGKHSGACRAGFKKTVSQTFAVGLFRWIALWVIVAFCASNGPMGIVAGVVIVAVEIVIHSSTRGVLLRLEIQTRKDWIDRLTNRLFYGLLIEEFRAGRGSTIDVDELFKIASQKSVADINKADADSIAAAGVFGTTGWHWFGGIISLLWQAISTILWYGSALALGSSIK